MALLSLVVPSDTRDTLCECERAGLAGAARGAAGCLPDEGPAESHCLAVSDQRDWNAEWDRGGYPDYIDAGTPADSGAIWNSRTCVSGASSFVS